MPCSQIGRSDTLVIHGYNNNVQSVSGIINSCMLHLGVFDYQYFDLVYRFTSCIYTEFPGNSLEFIVVISDYNWCKRQGNQALNWISILLNANLPVAATNQHWL